MIGAPSDRTNRWLTWLAAAAVALYSVCRYREALLTFFFFDDFWVMRDGARIHLRSAADLFDFFRPGHAGYALYRPLTTVGYSYLLQTLCGYDASAQHGFQLLVFAANVALAVAITQQLARSVVAAVAAGLLYAVAPGQAANAYWLAAFTVTGTAFWLLAMMACWVFAAPRWRPALCALGQIAALLSSEHGVAGPVLLAILAAMRRESARRALVAIAPAVVLVAGYLAAKLYYFKWIPSPTTVYVLAVYGLTFDVTIWLRHLGQYLVQCFTPLALWKPTDDTALLLAGGLIATLALTTWRAYRAGGSWPLAAGGIALFVASLGPAFPQRARFGTAYICVAVLGTAWLVIGLCQLASRYGSWLALALALAMVVVDQRSDERAWREPPVFKLIVNGSLGSARWMETARRAAWASQHDVLIPRDPMTEWLFGVVQVQTFFPEMPQRVTLYERKEPPPVQPGQVLLSSAVPLTTPAHFPGAQPRWNWLRRFAAPRAGRMRLGAQHEYVVDDARD